MAASQLSVVDLLEDTIGHGEEQKQIRFPKMINIPWVCSRGLQSHSWRASPEILMNIQLSSMSPSHILFKVENMVGLHGECL